MSELQCGFEKYVLMQDPKDISERFLKNNFAFTEIENFKNEKVSKK